jgi:hypothetical protein
MVSQERVALVPATGDDGLSASIRRTVVDQEGEWVKTAPRLYLNSFVDGEAKFDFEAGTRRTIPINLDTMTNVTLVWSHFFLVDGSVQSLFFRDSVARRLTRLLDIAGAPHISGIDRDQDTFFIARERLDSAVHVAGPTLYASSDDIDAWGMWLWYTLPAAMHFVENRHLYRNLVVSAAHKNMRDMLALIGVRDDEVIILEPSKSYRFDELHVFRRTYVNFVLWDSARAAFRKTASLVKIRVEQPRH